MNQGLFVAGLVIIVVCTAPGVVMAQDAGDGSDYRVRSLLESEGVGYSVDDNGDFRITFSWSDDERSQLVFINSTTSTLDNNEYREVWSIGYLKDNSVLSEEVMRNLLSDNARMKMGAWEMNSFGSSEVGIFSIKIPADADAETLIRAMNVVAIAADEKEKELLGSDRL